jgi:hypothetical protein
MIRNPFRLILIGTVLPIGAFMPFQSQVSPIASATRSAGRSEPEGPENPPPSRILALPGFKITMHMSRDRLNYPSFSFMWASKRARTAAAPLRTAFFQARCHSVVIRSGGEYANERAQVYCCRVAQAGRAT